jgi:hypothetical protein
MKSIMEMLRRSSLICLNEKARSSGLEGTSKQEDWPARTPSSEGAAGTGFPRTASHRPRG